ncbi:hypothetical protein I5Q82_06380 [Acutalibacter muris]|uniref:Glycoside hydrolase family 2 catalytic domain-containing protein n=2 Tax=Acutalibacter muris TaxID=1796620 RepID=A0AA92LA10_9FIRM|nr:hypothetical protein [Acutalibacter muris]QQR31292.1 hypothetical protein I5Q82_06380 [Acutalibacter muris]
MTHSLSGPWTADIGDGRKYTMTLPGTLDENNIGGPDTGGNLWNPDSPVGKAAKFGPILTRLTRKHSFEGPARLTRRVRFTPPEGKRVFLEAERARVLTLLVDGQEIPDFVPPSIVTHHIFELTSVWRGEHDITLIYDNSYPGLPRENIVYSSAATDETQTNWNGVLGFLRLRREEPVFMSGLRVYPRGGLLEVRITIESDREWSGVLEVSSLALSASAERQISVKQGRNEIAFTELNIEKSALRWDEYEGNLYELTTTLTGEGLPSQSKTVTFGVRDFGPDVNGRLALNGRTIFLRGEANCGEFPETGHWPMTVEEWTNILETYKSYGVNCMRFHSHTPPEAAFTAADRLGMLMEPELSHWNPTEAFSSRKSWDYYRVELLETLRLLANPPSFVMLTFGNELVADELGHSRMEELLDMAHKEDSTRLFANGSNVHYGWLGCDPKSDFYTSNRFREHYLRGTDANMLGYINHSYPSARENFDRSMDLLRESCDKPVFSFEVGQFEVLPDFRELDDFKGVTDPANLRWIKERVEKAGLLPQWERYVEATGELSRIGYREEIEAAMRTEKMSGISLLGLQDFPGQGTALVGMLNSHLKPKPYSFARPERFREFFTDRLSLALLPKYTYENTETLETEIKIANFGKGEIAGEVYCRLEGRGLLLEAVLPRVSCPAGRLTLAGRLSLPLSEIEEPTRLELTVAIGDIENRYPLWVYPAVKPVCPESVHETAALDEEALAVLEKGGTVYLTPPSTPEALPNSLQAQFTTDFWSVGTFPKQEGGMGQLINTEHPLFRDFPTESHSNWQWWPMASQRAMILPRPIECIVTEMDSYAFLRPMAKLFECRCAGGKVLVSSMALQDLQQYPEARALAGFRRDTVTIPESDLNGKNINEMALIDEEGVLAAIKTFLSKGKDEDVKFTFQFDDEF